MRMSVGRVGQTTAGERERLGDLATGTIRALVWCRAWSAWSCLVGLMMGWKDGLGRAGVGLGTSRPGWGEGGQLGLGGME